MNRFQSAKPALLFLAILGLLGPNSVFLYFTFARPEIAAAAYENPVALVFIVEAFFLMGLFAWGISKLGMTKPGWLAFIVLSIAGSMAFSVPFFLYLHLRKLSQVES